MKRVVLHIGFPKTGTTSFQLFCRAHRALLAEHCCTFPELHATKDGEAGHGALLTAMMTDPPPRLAPYAARSKVLLEEAFDAFRASDAETLLLSHETLSQARHLDHAELRARLGELPLTIVAVVRVLDRWIESLYGQTIKARTASFKPIAESRLGRFGSTRALPRLAHWREEWPRAAMRILSFERERTTGLMASLFAAAGVGSPALGAAIATAPPENASPDPLALLFVAYATLGSGAFAESRRLLAAMEAAGEPPLAGERFGLLPPALKAAARDQHIADLPLLRRRFGMAADDVAPCSPDELDYRHTLTRTEYASLLDRIGPQLSADLRDRLRHAWDVAAPRLA